jgi:hypothetical protein
MRRDVYIVNDGGSFSVVAADAVGRIIEDGREDDELFVNAYEAALFAIEGDDYSVIRVVAGEPLTAAEDAEWVARSRWRIKVGDGKALVCGGFDPDCLAQWQDEGETEYVKEIDVEPGDYQLVFYSYIHSMNGRMWLSDFYESFGGERLLPKLGPWFRKDHPGRALPTWVATELSEENLDEDDEWMPFERAVKSGRVSLEREPLHWIGYLIHLTPFVPGAELDIPEGGWFDPKTGLRSPSPCPLGIATECSEDTEVKRQMARLLGNEDED